MRRIGVRVGNWLTAEQGNRLLAGADYDSLRGKRNCAILAMLVGCGLRRGELLGLHAESIQLREERWVIADVLGEAGRVWGSGKTPKVPWEVVREAATRAGIEKLAPLGLRRTCARLCHLAGGEPLTGTADAAAGRRFGNHPSYTFSPWAAVRVSGSTEPAAFSVS